MKRRAVTQTANGTVRTDKRFKTVLVIAMLMSAAVGFWLILSPALDKQKESAQRQELLERLEAADGASEDAAAPPTSAMSDDSVPTTEPMPESTPFPELGEVTVMPDTSTEPPVIVDSPEPEAPEVIPDPIDDSEFPDAINGIGILSIEKIELRLPVAEGIDEKLLRIAPGHISETAEIGSTGNAVIVGHRNYDYGDMFNRLGEMVTGDIIEYKAKSGETMRFEVFEIAEINPGDQIAFVQPDDEAIITLYTCTPIRVATHRLLVRARLLGQ